MKRCIAKLLLDNMPNGVPGSSWVFTNIPASRNSCTNIQIIPYGIPSPLHSPVQEQEEICSRVGDELDALLDIMEGGVITSNKTRRQAAMVAAAEQEQSKHVTDNGRSGIRVQHTCSL